ncbi:hypothetical protein GCM10027566_13010 [Arachidicoccus ginsenosidivorans]
MKKLILLLTGTFLWIAVINAQTKSNSWLIDFGPAGNTNNCKPTESPDANGLYWNNFTGNNSGSQLQLIDTKGGNSNLGVQTLQSFVVNGGDLMGPTSTSKLGDLSVGTATMDFFFAQNNKPSLKITGLDPHLGYKFYLYGSRLSDETRITTYTLTGGNSASGDLQTSGKDLEGAGLNGNISKVYSSPMLFADQNGEILLEINNKTSAFGYLNALKLEAYTDAKIDIKSIELSGAAITTLGGTSQITAKITPSDASVTSLNWTVDDPTVATTDQNGLLKAKADGVVTVTATSMDDPTVKGTLQVQISGQTKASNEILIDFGPAGNTNNCKPTASPDEKGNYWTNITDNKSGAKASLTDIHGQATGITFTNLGEFGANPDALMGPLSVSDQLEELGVGTATMDFFYVENKTTSFQIGGLDPDKGYRFTLFGSRVTTETRVTGYSFHGIQTTTGTLQTSGTDLGGAGNHTNISSTYISPILYPDQNGQIILDVKNNASAYGYLNDLKLEVFDNTKVAVDHIELTGNPITEAGGSTEITAKIFPENATIKAVSWAVDNPEIAVIDSTGLLKALGNGTVQVTATSKANPAITASITIKISGQIEVKQSVLVDFGPEGNTQNCKPTASPDQLGHYWNNFTGNNQGNAISLIDGQNQTTGLTLTTTKTFSVNAGDLMAPTSASALLGPLNIGTATMDFFFVENNTGTLEITGLKPLMGYRLHLFGSRIQEEIRKTEFTITGLSIFKDTLQTSGKDLEGAGQHGNISQVSTTPIIFSDSTGKLQITLKNVASTYGYLNALQLESIQVPIIDPVSIAIIGADISTPGGSEDLQATIQPDNATIQSVYWSVDDPTIAKIDAAGHLRAIKNGTVTVTARSKQYGSEVAAHKKITISNQFQQLYVTGSALADNKDSTDFNTLRLIKKADGTNSGIFEIFTRLNATGSFYFQTENTSSGTHYGMGATDNTVVKDGAAFASSKAAIVRILVNMAEGTVSILPIDQLNVQGAAGAVPLKYTSQGIWSANVSMDQVITDGDKNFNFQIGQTDGLSIYRIPGTTDQIVTSKEAASLGYATEKIPADMNTYSLTVDLNNQRYTMACASLDPLKITIMGSSVAFGYGATDNHGYNYLFGQLLEKRAQGEGSKHWNLINHAISGNNTINVLDRWNRDLALGCGKYVIIGLSLGNEGIHESQDKEATYNQFKENLLKMMAMARAENMIPVINNNYTRSDYTPEDYDYIKKMDLFIHELDAPSVNLLGAIDDGQGHWVQGYRFDDLHPNDAGHAEMLYTIVPSLFDALDEGKPLPVRENSVGTNLNNTDSVFQIHFRPEYIVHPFTISFSVKTKGSGLLASFRQLNNLGTLAVDSLSGVLKYSGPKGQTIKSTTAINDDNWHQITLTHFYARGVTILYIDGIMAGQADEQLLPSDFYLGDVKAADAISFKELFFYRAGMSPEAIGAMQAGKMLKSSLEIYAPLSDGSLDNLAQSTNTLEWLKTAKPHPTFPTDPTDPTQVDPSQGPVILYPNPVKDKLQFSGLKAGAGYQLKIYTISGKLALASTLAKGASVSLAKLPSGKYFIVLVEDNTKHKQKFSIIKR